MEKKYNNLITNINRCFDKWQGRYADLPLVDKWEIQKYLNTIKEYRRQAESIMTAKHLPAKDKEFLLQFYIDRICDNFVEVAEVIYNG